MCATGCLIPPQAKNVASRFYLGDLNQFLTLTAAHGHLRSVDGAT